MPGIDSHGLLYECKKMDSSYALYEPSSTERGELAVIKFINEYIKELGVPIDIIAGNFKLLNVYGANKISGTPKADISLVTYNTIKKKFEDVFFLSHKMGAAAKDFQQYSGTTSKADGNRSGSISNDKTVISFLRKLVKLHPIIVDGRQRYFTPISDKNLIDKAVFGPEFGTNKFSIDNIHALGQGISSFTKSGKFHKLSFSAGMEFNPGDIKKFTGPGYKAIIGARYSSGRNFEIDGKVYSNVRVLIMPEALIGSTAKRI